jgi:hypothetical protein
MLYQLSYVRSRGQRYHQSLSGPALRNDSSEGWLESALLTTM